MRLLRAGLLATTLLVPTSDAPATAQATEGPAAALVAASGDQLEQLQWRLTATARNALTAASARQDWSAAELDALLERLLLDPGRLEDDAELKARVLPIAAAALPAEASEQLRDQLLSRLSATAGLGLFDLETIELGWGTVRRSSAERHLETAGADNRWQLSLAHEDDPITVSIYSLSGTLFEVAEAETFLRSVRRWAPDRSLLVLADYPLSRELAPLASELKLDLMRTWSRAYSPWPRDPMSLLWGVEAGPVLVLRPNRQPTREFDSGMGLELIQELPVELDERLGGLRWAVAPVPFHNGNMLSTPDTLWISLHTLESRILEILGVDRVPVESFTTSAGVTAYLRAARRAAHELESVFGKPTEFVHALPDTSAPPGALQVAMRRIGSGAGFDLDSTLTILPAGQGRSRPMALVGQPSLGAELIQQAPEAEIERLRSAYDLEPTGRELAERIAEAQNVPRSRGLEVFLDLIASHFTEMGLTVQRLPLLLVPTSLVRHSERYPDPHFLLSWNNVVLDSVGDQANAEGFASMFDSGDQRAREVFAEFGYRLELLPPLTESVLRNGGYRCASNHIRQ